ncbi:farnesol dehydrogenase-like [Zophobas morio]|uniref:farnesol dehydrogenase-like n=1 Tax=Zophobas morio TaxID=2755281 RepID=UPI0030830C98
MVLSMQRWIGKIAIVTGASSGIGAAIADHLVEKGLIVVGLARRSERIEKRSKALDGKKGKLYAVRTDMSKEEEILRAFQWVESNLGHVHILINNAAVLKESYLHEGKTEDWRATLDVNVLGLCTATREAFKIMRANGISGHIININSLIGHKLANIPIFNVYSASKYAVGALSGILRQELDNLNSKIKVTSLSPGLVSTEMTDLNPENSAERIHLLNSLPMIKADDIADAVDYVLSTPENVQIQELIITPIGEKL